MTHRSILTTMIQDSTRRQPERVLKVAVSEWASLRPECLSVNMTCEPGFELEILAFVAVILNFKMKFIRSNVAGCGEQMKNGSWSGILGMVQSGQADITGNLCMLNEERSSGLNHTWPVNFDSRVFLIRAPEPIFVFKWQAPFELAMWYFLLIIVLIFFVIFTFSMYFRFSSLKTAMIESTKEIIAATTNMDGRYISYHWILYSFFMGFTFLIYSTFIMSALIMPVKICVPFSNQLELNDKLYDGKYKLISYHNPPKYCYGDCDKFYQALSRNGYYNIASLTDDVQSTKLMDHILNSQEGVFINTDRAVKALLDSYKFRFKLWLINDESATSLLYSYFVQKDLQWKRLIDEALIFLDSSKDNIQDRYRGLWNQVKTDKEIKGEISYRVSVSVRLIAGPFVYYGYGIGLSILALVIENMICKLHRH